MPLGSRKVTIGLRMRSDDDALPFVDSGCGSSILLKQSSKSIDFTDDDETTVPTKRRVRPQQGENLPKKRKLRELLKQQPANEGDEIEPILDLEAVQEMEVEELGLGSEEELELEPEVPAQKNKRFCVGVRVPPFVHPKSQYEGYKYHLPKEKEWLVVKNLLVSSKAQLDSKAC